MKAAKFENIGDHMVRISWEAMPAGDEGEAVWLPASVDKTVEISGVFGGATCAFKGTNEDAADSANDKTLQDVHAGLISKAARDIVVLEQAPARIYPKVTGGDGSTAITVRFIARKA
jgi:hypothetical protein